MSGIINLTGSKSGIIGKTELGFQSGCSVKKDATQAGTNGVWHKHSANVDSGGELYDINNEYDNATNYRFTAKAAGKYLVTLNGLQISVPDGHYAINRIYKNGSGVGTEIIETAGAAIHVAPSQTMVINLNVNDYIEHWILSSGTSIVWAAVTNMQIQKLA